MNGQNDIKEMKKIMDGAKTATGYTSSHIINDDELEEIPATIKKVDVEKLRKEIEKRDLDKKTKAQLIEELTDLKDLYAANIKECKSLKVNLNDALGDIHIKDELLKENKKEIKRLDFANSMINRELGIQQRVQQKMDEILDKIIGGIKRYKNYDE